VPAQIQKVLWMEIMRWFGFVFFFADARSLFYSSTLIL
jgi:hypothetical protein